jgi:pimeloyl-ACP methyl ester carboxylesterase
MAELTPYYVRVDAITKFKWSCAYLTRELDPQIVYRFLRSCPELQDDYMPPPPRAPRKKLKPGEKEKAKPPEKPAPTKPTTAMIVSRRVRISDFLVQAGLFDLAGEELDRLLKDYPQEKQRVEEARGLLGRLRARDQWEEIKNWYHAGRYEGVRKRVDSFDTKYASDRVKADVREMQARIARKADMVAEARKTLDEWSKEAMGTEKGRALASAVRLIRKEVGPATVERLDAFLSQARNAQRLKARKKKATMTPEQILSLAVTGFLLGSPSAEARPEGAISLWKTRQLVLNYCKEAESTARRRLLDDYLATVTPRVDLDEIAQLIDHLPPADPADKITTEVTAVKVGEGRAASTYHLKLPPEYTHGRQCPVLIVLAEGGEKATTMLERWSKPAADQGYILAAPEWDRAGNDRYTYSEREQDAVLDTLRDLRRRYGVDSDRVFLFGLGEGGSMALDVGLAHPDLFAGIIPMCAGPNYYARRYWRNAQYLPFYAVNGTRAGASSSQLREQYTDWMQRGYPTLWIEYKGRGTEWLGGEVPNILDWMRNQRRAFPLHQLGTDGGGGTFGNEFCTMRPEDNRFYWLSTNDIYPGHVITSPERWTNLKQPAAMTARIDSAANEIYVRTQGLGQVSVWMGRNSKGQYMVDFEKPVTVRVGLRSVWPKRMVTPSLGLMLEELYRRGDRKHLFLARIDVKLR